MDRLILEAGEVDLARRCVRRTDGELLLTEQEVALLRYLADRPGAVVAREGMLADVLGYTASTVTRAVDAAMSRLRQKVELDPASPAHIHTVRGVGYRFEAVPTRHGARASDPDPDPELPPELDPLVDREADVAMVLDAFERGDTLVTLLGGPGAGKTRLALRIAHRLRLAGNTVAFARLGADGDGDVVGTVATALGVTKTKGDPADRVARHLRPGHVITLDALDDLPDAAVQAITAWRTASPGTRWLVTSRSPSRLPGERRFAVGPLPDGASAELLAVRADAVCTGWSKAPGAADAIARIARALDGNPFALALAAARAVVLSPDALAAAIEAQPFAVLSGLHRALALAWATLPPRDQARMQCCAVFGAPFTADDARAVAGDLALDLDALQGLVERSLVRAVHERGATRFALDGSVRRFAQDALVRSGDAGSVHERLEAWVVTRGEALIDALPTSAGEWAAAELRALLPHARDAHDRAAGRTSGQATGQAVAGRLRLARVVAEALAIHGTPRQTVDALSPALDAALVASDPMGAAAEAIVAQALVLRSCARRELADPRAVDDCDAARARVSAETPAAVAGRVRLHEALLATDARRYADAAEYLASALQCAPGDRELEARVWDLTGRIAAERLDLAGARAAFERMESLAGALGAWRLAMNANLKLGHLAQLTHAARPAVHAPSAADGDGDALLDEADRRFDAALAIGCAVGAAECEARVHGARTGVRLSRGDLDGALASAERALAGLRRAGDLVFEVGAILRVGAVRLAAGDVGGARAACAEALGLAERLGDPADVGNAAGNLAVCLFAAGDAARAEPLITRAVATVPGEAERAYFLAHQAMICAERDRVDDAERALAASAGVLGDAGPLIRWVAGLVALARARLSASQGRTADADAARADAAACLAAGRAARASSGPWLALPTARSRVPALALDGIEARLVRGLATGG